MSKQWVQHKSGQGEKWEVVEDRHGYSDVEWRVKAKLHEYHHDLPKSEYIPCDPPEEWEDVTREYRHNDGNDQINLLTFEKFTYIDGPHSGPCFIVERRKP